ncbi:13410_t:CDS:2, partial [Racocetra fulgida]
MVIRSPNGHSEVIDFRETAPLAAKKDMFVDKQIFASIGGLSIVKATGGIMTLEDLENYRPIVRKPLVGFYHGRKNEPFEPEQYNPVFEPVNDYGTSHLSVIDADDMAVSVTSSINQFWGSQVVDPDTEILLNDHMDDFSVPGTPDKPLSSMIPTIIEKDEKLELVIGG